MIGIMNTKSPKAASGQNMDNDNPNIKSPSNVASQKSMITSFFKPKTPKQSPEMHQNSLNQGEIGICPYATGTVMSSNDTEMGYFKGWAADKGQRSGQRRDGLDAPLDTDELVANQTNCLDSAQSQRQIDLGDLVRGSTSQLKHVKGKPRKTARTESIKRLQNESRKAGIGPPRCSTAPSNGEKASKKRKKKLDLDSSSDDFQIDKKSKMQKKELSELNEENNPLGGAAPEARIPEGGLLNHDAPTSTQHSDEDIFEVQKPTANPQVISYLDFLNESIGENHADGDDIDDSADDEIKDQGVTEDQHVEEKPQVDTELKLRERHTCIRKKRDPGTKARKTPKPSIKPSKFSTSTRNEEACTRRGSDFGQGGGCPRKKRWAEPASVPCLPDDDSVLTISYSEFMDDKTGSKSGESSSLSLMPPRQKLVTIEAEVHSPPSVEAVLPGNSPVSVDLCCSPERCPTPASRKRTSNVVVSVSDLDLVIVSTDNASASADNRKSKTVYSIFQKKGTIDTLKQAESNTLKKPETSTDPKEVSALKPKQGRSRKRHKDAEFSPKNKSRSLLRNVDGTLTKVCPKTKSDGQAKKTLKDVFDSLSEDESTAFEVEMSKKNESLSRKGRPRRSPRIFRGDEDGREIGGTDVRKTFQRAQAVLTSTPKTNQNTKARQLLRRARTQQLNKTSAIPSQAKDSKLNCWGTKCATRVDPKQTRPEVVIPVRKQTDLTTVMRRRCAPKEAVDEGNKNRQTTQKRAERKKAVITEDQERKPTKLAPMFTKEGRRTLGSKRSSQDHQTGDHSVMIVPDDDDEASRDSIRSEFGGGAKVFGDALARRRDVEAERSYPPFPEISHVLQMAPEIDGDRDWWKLPAPGILGKFLIADESCASKLIKTKSNLVSRHMRLGEFTTCSAVGEKTQFLKTFTGHPELSHDTQRLILDQIKAANPQFPVNRVFKRYLSKRKGEPLIPKPLQGEGTSEAQGSSSTDSNFTKLKTGQPSAKRKSEVIERQVNSKRRKVAPDRSTGNPEARIVGKIRLRRRSSRWVIRDDNEEETKDCNEPPTPRRSCRQSVQKEDIANKPKERRTLRARRGKVEAEKEGKKEGCRKAEETKAAESKADKLASLLWTEKYQPRTSAEIIGNGQAMKRLTGWLTEWKKKSARIKKKMRRQQVKGRSKALPALPLEDSDSDFDLGSDSDNSDSDNDDDRLSNAMLIVGPCGCGKTAAVYACARELGFKVFEVNASSKRTGKQILADLGEATQSHHLTANHHGNGAPKCFFLARSPPKSAGKAQAKKTPIPKAFAAFYKAGADAAAKEGGKKVKDKKSLQSKKSAVTASKSGVQTPKAGQPLQAAAVTSTGDKAGTSGHRLTSTSLILFEDVDVVFEEDKGFLSAIATFLKTTKRPIILTTSDGRFAGTFEERYEMVTFRKPPSSQLATHLQLLCLAENVNTSHSDQHRLVRLLDRDVRRCWLAAQLWVNSGADHGPKAGHSDLGRAQMVDPGSEAPRDIDAETKKGVGCSALPRMHCNCFESTMGLCNMSNSASPISSVVKVHRSGRSCLHASSSIGEIFQKETNASVYFRNIHTFLPPFSLEDPVCANLETSTDQSQRDSNPPMSNDRTPTLLTHKLVSSLATFADNISFMDSHTLAPRHDGKGRSRYGWWGAEVKPSLLPDPADSDAPNCAMPDTSSSMRGFLEGASFNCCHRNYEKAVDQFQLLHRLPRDNCLNRVQEETPQKMTNPAENLSRCDQVRSVLKLYPDDCMTCPDIYSTIVNKLPLSVHCNHQVVSMEYLSTLRCICRSEQIREELKIKRRFLHYLDTISLNLKKTDRITLCSIMEVKQPADKR